LTWSIRGANLKDQPNSYGEKLVINNNDILIDAVYDVKMVMTEVQKHNFYVSKVKSILPSKCYRAVDSESNEVTTSKNQIIGASPESVSDMCFDFKTESLLDGCNESVKSKVFIESQPALPNDIIDLINES